MKVNFVNRIYEAEYNIKYNYCSCLLSPYAYTSSEKIGVVISRSKNCKLLRYDIICTRELDQPPLEIGSTIYDKELEIMFTVCDFIRNTDNNYTCIVKDTIEDTPNSLNRKCELESEIILQEEKVDGLKNRIEQLKIELNHEKSKSIWKLLIDRLLS